MEKLVDLTSKLGELVFLDVLGREMTEGEAQSEIKGICNVTLCNPDSWDDKSQNYRGVIVYMPIIEYENFTKRKKVKGGNE